MKCQEQGFYYRPKAKKFTELTIGKTLMTCSLRTTDEIAVTVEEQIKVLIRRKCCLFLDALFSEIDTSFRAKTQF